MPLAEAAVAGNADVVRRLLTAGADVEAQDADGQTALMIAARSSVIEVARLLLENGADANARERWREQTPLMWAAAQSRPAMVDLLLAHGADVTARSDANGERTK
jgi:ankyrin repeat protein